MRRLHLLRALREMLLPCPPGCALPPREVNDPTLITDLMIYLYIRVFYVCVCELFCRRAWLAGSGETEPGGNWTRWMENVILLTTYLDFFLFLRACTHAPRWCMRVNAVYASGASRQRGDQQSNALFF